MNNWEISKIMRHLPSTKNRFIGVFSADKIPTNIALYTLPCCFIANTDPSWKSGSHWVAVFIDKNGHIEYFDSYGRRPMSPRMKKFCGRHYQYNPYMIQTVFSTLCGHYCIFYLVHRCRGVSFVNIMNMFDFDNLNYNDNLVKNFVKFHPRMFVKSTCCSIKQCCKPLK